MIRYTFRDDEPLRLKGAKLADPQRIGEALQKIADKTGGNLSPDDVVQAARARSSPLHKHFEWNVEKAAEAHWREQARTLIRCVRVVEEDSEKQPASAWYSINHKSGRRYEPLEKVRRSVDFQSAIFKQALQDLEAFEARFAELKEVCALVAEARRKLKERFPPEDDGPRPSH